MDMQRIESEALLAAEADNSKRLAREALLHLLRFATAKPSMYTMACEILRSAMMVPQESKGLFVNGLAQLYTDAADAGDAWIKFRSKLQGILLKQQGLIQALELLLQDWQIEEPTIKQMEMFAAAKARTDVPDMTTGEVL